MIYFNMIYALLIGGALITVGRLIYDYKKASVGVLLIYFLNGTLLLGLIRLFLALVALQVIKIDDSTAMVIWHLMFYVAIGLFVLATRILVKIVGQTEYKEPLSRALLVFCLSIFVFGLLFVTAPSFDKLVVATFKDTFWDRVGLPHFIAFGFAGLVSYYLLQVQQKFEGNIKAIAFPLLFSIGTLSIIHLWELLNESWGVIKVSEDFGEGVEMYLWIPVYLLTFYAFWKFREVSKLRS